MSSNRKIRFGVIGAGRIGKIHAGNLSAKIPGAELQAISDIQLDLAQDLAEQLAVPKATGDYRALLGDDGIDAIAICSATDTHTEIIEAACKAGKHIFCEKPIDIDLVRLDSALEAVQQAGIKFQVGFNRRFDPNFKKVQEMVAEGAIGDPHILRITSRDPAPPPIEYVQISGGIFLDMTIHDFDMARFLIGREVERVFATGEVRVDPAIGEAGDIDTALITLWFEDGTIGSIDNSRQAVYGYDQRVEVFGSSGMISVSNEVPDTVQHANEEGVHASLPLHFFLERYEQSYAEEMKAFVNALLEDKDPLVGGSDGRIPVLMGYAALKSLQENRPVTLSEVDR